MKIRLNIFLFATFSIVLLNISSLNVLSQIYNAKDYGFKSENPANARSLNELIERVSKDGGGTIFIPSGQYLTGAIELKSNIHLSLDAGTLLKFSGEFGDYPFVETRWSGVDCIGFSPLIYANGAENVSITGKGIIDGNAFTWWERQSEIMSGDLDNIGPASAWEKQLAELNRDRDPGDLNGSHRIYWLSQFLRPPVIQFYNCSNVVLRDVTILNSPFWTVHPVYCDDVTIDNVKIYNPPGTQNTDGINPESSRNVRISNCLIEADDDCITIKSGRDSEGRRVGIPAENITITNCILNRGYGGITIGSEMSGGVRNVVVSNCIINNIDWGIRIKTQRGRGGVIENILIDNIFMENVTRGISINARYTRLEPEEVSERTPRIKNIRISGIGINDADIACEILGLDEMPVEGISLDNLSIYSNSGFVIENTVDLFIRNINLHFKTGPAIKLEKSSRVRITDFNPITNQKGEPLIICKDVEDAFINNYKCTSKKSIFKRASPRL